MHSPYPIKLFPYKDKMNKTINKKTIPTLFKYDA